MADEISILVLLNATYNNCAKYISVLNIVCRNIRLCGLVETYRNVEDSFFRHIKRKCHFIFPEAEGNCFYFLRHTGKNFCTRPHGVTF